jgi:predicted  nucleic acid-binding Zn-ribbon protein
MFSQESKLAVLESKLGIYEDLSREMLAKLESAVDKISEGNSRIATILAKHDERIEQSMKNDDLIVKMIDEMKEDNDKEHQQIADKFDKINSKLEELSRFRWQISAVVAFAVFLIGIIPTVTSLTSKASQGYNGSTQIQNTKK